MKLTLISHSLCPYVQRAAIVLAEKEVAFERRNIALSDKPAWFVTSRHNPATQSRHIQAT